MVFLFGSKALALPTGLLCGPLPHREGSHSGGEVYSPLGKAAENVPFASAGGPLSVFAHRKRPVPYSPAERMKAWQPTASNTLHPRCAEGDISLFRPTKKFPQAWRPTGTFSVISLFPLRRSRLGIRAEVGRQFGWLFHGGVSARAAGQFPHRQRRRKLPFLPRPAAPDPPHLRRVEGSVSLLPPAKKSSQIWQPMETFLLSLFPLCGDPVWE